MIVVVYVGLYTCFKLIETVEFVQVKELGFQRAKKPPIDELTEVKESGQHLGL